MSVSETVCETVCETVSVCVIVCESEMKYAFFFAGKAAVIFQY